HAAANVADGAHGVQSLGADDSAVLDVATTKKAVRVLVVKVQSLPVALVAAVFQEAVGPEQGCGTGKALRIPPPGRAAGGAAGAENALVEAVQRCALLR